MINGILAVNKPEGISSAGVVARVKKSLNVKKVGHTGTLDPFATGVLLCAINKGTRISQYFLNGEKRYQAEVHLGLETDTFDCTGKIMNKADDGFLKDIDLETILNTIHSFKGVQEQVPPAFSALKKNGRPLYKFARQGIQVKADARTIEIYDIQVKELALPKITIDVHCSAGTYIRSIAHDIGTRLGCGAHLSALCRTRSSQFSLADTIMLEDIESFDEHDLTRHIVPLSQALRFLPKIETDQEAVKKIGHGQRLSANEMGIDPDDFSDGRPVRLVDDRDQLLAIIRFEKITQSYNYSCVFVS